MPKSETSDVATSVKFVNRSGTQAEIFWFDFDGEPQSYGVIPPGEKQDIETYVSHPWCAKENPTGKDLTLKKKDVFWPKKSKKRRKVKIRVPEVPKHDDSSSSSDSDDSDNEGKMKKQNPRKGSGSDSSDDEGKKHRHKKDKDKKKSRSCTVL